MTVKFENGRELTTDQHTLNFISLALDYASYTQQAKDIDVADRMEKMSKEIYDALNKIGYYNR